MNSEINASTLDSIKNCTINCDLKAPTDFLTPISRALFIDLAKEIVIKLMLAINRTSAAIADRIIVYLGSLIGARLFI